MFLFVSVLSFSSLADVKPNPELECCVELNAQLQEQNDVLIELFKNSTTLISTNKESKNSDINILNNNGCIEDGDNGSDWLDFFLRILTIITPIVIAWFAANQAIRKIKVNAKLSFEHDKATRISHARIEWMQSFRSKVSVFASEVAALNYYLRDVAELSDQKKEDEANKLYQEQVERLVGIRAISTELKLFLNKKEDLHYRMDLAINNFMETALESYEKVADRKEYMKWSDEVEKLAAEILKEVWEQAKSDGNDIDEKNFS